MTTTPKPTPTTVSLRIPAELCSLIQLERIAKRRSTTTATIIKILWKHFDEEDRNNA